MSGGRLSVLGQHAWVNRLTVGDQYTTAWVLTNIRHEQHILIYRGFVQAAHLRKDGTFAYIVLSGVRKLYLTLTADGAITTSGRSQLVGEKTREVEQNETIEARKRFVDSSLVIEGEDIANVMFDRYELSIDTGRFSDKDFEEAVLRVLQQFQAGEEGVVAAGDGGETHAVRDSPN